MNNSILVDGAQFLKKQGTGIAGYARVLVDTLRSCSCDVSVLYGREVSRPGTVPDLCLAGEVFGNSAAPHPIEQNVQRLVFLARTVLGFGATCTAHDVPLKGINLDGFEPSLPQADRVLNAHRIYASAHYRFALKRRMTQVTLPADIQLAHWTSPLPVNATNIPNVYTIHDVIPLQFPHFVIDRKAASVYLFKAVADQADLIITVSNASKQGIIELLGVSEERVAVTHQPAPPMPALPRIDAERLVRDAYGLSPGEYLVSVGAIEPKKNRRRLVDAFALSVTNLPLVLIGGNGWLYEEDLSAISRFNRHVAKSTGKRIVRCDYLPRSHVVALVQCARCLVFPSLVEGFGLPVLEAMSLGVPVLTSNGSSLPEVAGDAAVLVDPLSIEDIARGLTALTNDEGLRDELIAKGRVRAQLFDEGTYRSKLAAAYRQVGVDLPEPRSDNLLIESGCHTTDI